MNLKDALTRHIGKKVLINGSMAGMLKECNEDHLCIESSLSTNDGKNYHGLTLMKYEDVNMVTVMTEQTIRVV